MRIQSLSLTSHKKNQLAQTSIRIRKKGLPIPDEFRKCEAVTPNTSLPRMHNTVASLSKGFAEILGNSAVALKLQGSPRTTR